VISTGSPSPHSYLRSAADLCAAANIDAPTFKNWISREPYAIRLTDDDRRAIGTGRPHLFTFRTVLAGTNEMTVYYL
jgi:hypothetical protein